MSGRYAQIEAAVKCSAIYQDLKTSKTYVDGWQSTIYKAYFSGLCQGISPQNMAKNMVRKNVPPSVGSWRSPIESRYCGWMGHLIPGGEPGRFYGKSPCLCKLSCLRSIDMPCSSIFQSYVTNKQMSNDLLGLLFFDSLCFFPTPHQPNSSHRCNRHVWDNTLHGRTAARK